MALAVSNRGGMHFHGHHHRQKSRRGQQFLRYRGVSMVLELGIVVHSIVVELGVGASNDVCTIKPLVVALCFHQIFEGMGLGGCILQDLIIAGFDNVSNNCEWAMVEMINQPRLLDKAVRELDIVVGKDRLVQESDLPNLNYIKACAKEAFRLHPVAPFNVPHVTTADATVAGYFIPKGSHVLVSRLGLGMNPEVLRLGIVIHSIVVELGVRASNDVCTIKPLVAALCFHQFFEGMGFGGYILQADYKTLKKAIDHGFFLFGPNTVRDCSGDRVRLLTHTRRIARVN